MIDLHGWTTRNSHDVTMFFGEAGAGSRPSALSTTIVTYAKAAHGQRRERLPGRPDHEIRSLAELPGLLAVPGAAR